MINNMRHCAPLSAIQREQRVRQFAQLKLHTMFKTLTLLKKKTTTTTLSHSTTNTNTHKNERLHWPRVHSWRRDEQRRPAQRRWWRRCSESDQQDTDRDDIVRKIQNLSTDVNKCEAWANLAGSDAGGLLSTNEIGATSSKDKHNHDLFVRMKFIKKNIKIIIIIFYTPAIVRLSSALATNASLLPWLTPTFAVTINSPPRCSLWRARTSDRLEQIKLKQ